MKRTAIALTTAALLAGSAQAVTVFSDDFTGFTGSGFSPTPAAGQLDSDTYAIDGFGTDVAFGGTGTSGDPARGASTGGVSTGGVYAFDTGGGNPGLGVQPGGSDFTPGTFQVRFTYTGVDALESIAVAFDVSVYNDQARSNSFELTSIDVDGGEVLGSSVGVTSAGTADGSPAWATSNLSTGTITTAVENGDVITLTFSGDDAGGSGSRDEFALDNINVTGVVPEPTSLALLGLGSLLIARRRRA